MKNLVYLLIALLIITNAAWGIWAYRLHLKPVSVGHLAPINPPTFAPHPPSPNVSTADQWQDYQATRIKVLQDHPELAAEQKAIQDEMADERAKLNAAMIEADPKVGPILAKLDLLRQRSQSPGMPPVRPAPGAQNH